MLNLRHFAHGETAVPAVAPRQRSPRRIFGRSSRLSMRLRRWRCCCLPQTLVSALRKETMTARTEKEQRMLESLMCTLFCVLCVTTLLLTVCFVHLTLSLTNNMSSVPAGEENYVTEVKSIVDLMHIFGIGRRTGGKEVPQNQPRAMHATERLFETLLRDGNVDRLVGLYSRQGLAPHTAQRLRQIDAIIALIHQHDANLTEKKARNTLLIPPLAYFLMKVRDNRTNYKYGEHDSYDMHGNVALPPVNVDMRVYFSGSGGGFISATASTPEVEQQAPFSDIIMLVHRHALMSNSNYTMSSDELRDLYSVSSIFNNRFYYPARRWQQAQPYTSETKESAALWYSAVLEEARQHFATEVDNTNYALSIVPSDLTEKVYREAETFFTESGLAPLPHASVKDDRASIFVNFASYRDVECSNTLVDMYSKAKNPHRIFVGVAQQNAVIDSPCIDARLLRPIACYKPAAEDDVVTTRNVAEDYSRGVCYAYSNVRVRRIRHSQAYGPTYGRYMAMLLYRGEDYILAIDSHNRFMPFWDAALLRMHHKYSDHKAILSHYPLSWEPTKSTNLMQSATAYLCRCHFLRDYGYVRLDAIVVHKLEKFSANNKHNDPYIAQPYNASVATRDFRLPQPWVAGGFMFGNASFQRAVPYDPHLPHTFDGEEVLLSVRLWTHGYNIYSPERSVVYHFYLRQKAPKVWNDSPRWFDIQERSRQRIQYLLRVRRKPDDVLRYPRNVTATHITLDLDRYSMGKERTVQQWYNYAGLDPIRERLTKKWC